MNFEAYLSSKKIDSAAFKKAEPVLWDAWRKEFEQVHPNSFTAQKLYLINPIRRKYHQAIEALPEVLKSVEVKLPVATPVKTIETPAQGTDTEQSKPKPVVARPMMKPKLPTSASSISNEVTPAEKIQQVPPASAAATSPAKPASAKPVIPKPVIKPKPVAEDSIDSGNTPTTDATAIASAPELKTEQAPVNKPMAKPVIPRPVIKPKPVAEQSIHEETTPVADAPAAIAPSTEIKTEQAPVSKPMVKPVIPRPVIKPKTPAPEVEKQSEQTTEPLHDSTPTQTTPAPPSETPPAKAAKPAIPRPVIKPPKPKTD